MNMVSLKQSQEVMAKAATNCGWDEVASEQAQQAVGDPIRFGREFTRFLQNGGRVQIVSTGGIVPPQGGRILVVTVPVDESRPWKGAVSAVGSDTGRNWNIWKVGDQYPPVAGATQGLHQIFLANFGKYTWSEGNLIWAEEQHLRPESPRAVFAVLEHCPYLNLAMDPMAVVSLVPCRFEGRQYVCGGWWDDSVREANLGWFESEWFDCCWFAFARE